LPRGRSQPVSSVSARRGLLVVVVNAPRDAQTLGLAGHAVRHLAAAPDQTCRARHRTENPNQNPPAVQRPRSGDLRHAARTPAASRHLRAGAWCPRNRPPFFNLSADPNPENIPAAAAAILHARRAGVQPIHECSDTRPANLLYSCIGRVRWPEDVSGTHATQCRRFLPNVESLAPGSSDVGGSDMIATEVKQVVDLCHRNEWRLPMNQRVGECIRRTEAEPGAKKPLRPAVAVPNRRPGSKSARADEA
jgi:hypothetical protein